eukprot:378647_1
MNGPQKRSYTPPPEHRAYQRIRCSSKFRQNIVRESIAESFASKDALDHYMDRSPALQIESGEMIIGDGSVIKVLNYDFHDIQTGTKKLYFVAKKLYPAKPDEYQWKIRNDLFTADMLCNENYGIVKDDIRIPKTHRKDFKLINISSIAAFIKNTDEFKK